MIRHIVPLGACAGLALLFSGCQSLTQETTHATTLASSMATNHTAAIALLNRANTAMEPYLIDQAVASGKPTFSKADLTVLAAADIAAWDKILAGLDAYCSALSALASGKGADATVTASEALGGSMTDLAKATKTKATRQEDNAASALSALADVLIREKAGHDAQVIAQKGDPDFQKIIGILTTALQGVKDTYDLDYSVATAKENKEFRNDTASGLDTLGEPQRKAKLEALQAWLKTEAEHDDLILAFTTLNTSLTKAAAAHKAIADGGKADMAGLFADLEAEAQTVTAICQKFKN